MSESDMQDRLSDGKRERPVIASGETAPMSDWLSALKGFFEICRLWGPPALLRYGDLKTVLAYEPMPGHVTAANAHDGLVAALKLAHKRLSKHSDGEANVICERIAAALAKPKGEAGNE